MAPRVGNLEIPSYQQNGSFKINIGKAKKHLLLLTKKLQADLPYVIEKYDIKNATVSSVNKDSKELGDFLAQKVRYIPFSTQIKAGITNNYQSLHTLGLDRWAKVIAAKCLYANNNCLLIDAGTCITYDSTGRLQKSFPSRMRTSFGEKCRKDTRCIIFLQTNSGRKKVCLCTCGSKPKTNPHILSNVV